MMVKLNVLIFLIASLISMSSVGNDVFVYLRNGSSVKVQLSNPQFDWLDASPGPESTKQTISWTDVRELRVADSQVDEQVREIGKWLEELNDRSYSVRERAEELLADPDNSAAFKSIIRRYGETIEDDEARYRVSRILEEISDVDDNFGASFDQLIMQDGTIKIGNAANFALVGLVFGKPLRFGRKQVQNIYRPEPNSVVTTNPERVSVQTYNSLDSGSFYKEKEHIIASFETDRFANPTVIGRAVGELFTHQGLLLQTEKPGEMILIKYEFKFCPVDAGTRCICPYDEATEKRLRGITVISFCSPDQPNVAAGVHEFGIFLERIEHSRDVVVEAYNVHGQMLGIVEATDQTCVFAGFNSTEPIVRIRILRNPNLPELERLIDETYAFDSLSFSKPEPIPEMARLHRGSNVFAAKINLEDGQFLTVKDCILGLENVSFTNPVTNNKANLTWKTVRSVAMPYIGDGIGPMPVSGISRTLMVQLESGSIVRTERENYLAAYDFIGKEFQADKIVAVWHGTARMPEYSDFESGKPVVVFPSCRIVTEDFQLENNSLAWDKSASKKITKQVLFYDEEQDVNNHEKFRDPDLTPDISHVDFSKLGEEIPTLWLKQPVVLDLTAPHVRLFDGQIFLLGGPDGFRIAKIDNQKKSIEIFLGDQSKTYPLSRVASIRLPKPVDRR